MADPQQVTIFAPDGTQGTVPADKVADAVKAGGKLGVHIYAPDGTPGYVPQDKVQDALAAGGKMEPPDTRSLFQKAKDNFNANTQGAKPGEGPITSFVHDFSAGGGDVVRAIAHPIRTIESMASTPDAALAAVAHFAGDDTALNKIASQPPTSVARALGQAGTGALVGEAAGGAAGAAAEAIKRGAGTAVLLGKTPAEAYESALKPSTTLTSAERAQLVETGLDNSLPISKGGVEKLQGHINTLNQAITDEIAADPNRPIDPNKVATRADIAKAKFANQVNAQGDLNSIDASKQQFLDEQGAKSGTPATPPKPTGILDAQGNPIMTSGTPATPPTPAPAMNASGAQTMKQGTYRVLSGKFGEQGSASVEAQKALARGLKEEIATQFPGISELNASESRLLDLQPVLERAVGRISNHQLIGIGTPVAGAATSAVTGSGGVGAVASVLKAVLDNPNVKSRLAIAVSKSSKIPYATAASRVQAYSAALGATAAASQAYSSDDNPSQLATPQP